MKNIVVTAVIATTVLAGCGHNTGIVKISDDTYMLAKQNAAVWSGASVKVELFQEANAFCAKQGKKFVQVSSSSVDAVSMRSMAGADIQFKCE